MIKIINIGDIQDFVENIINDTVPDYDSRVLADSFCVTCEFYEVDASNDINFKNLLDNASEVLRKTGYFLEPIPCVCRESDTYKIIYVYTKDIQIQ